MADTVPDFSIKEVESFCFHLHCIYKGKTKQRSTIHINTQKFVQPANENFTKFFKDVYESWRTLFPSLILKKLKPFVSICIVSTRERLKIGPIYLKTLEKFV